MKNNWSCKNFVVFGIYFNLCILEHVLGLFNCFPLLPVRFHYRA